MELIALINEKSAFIRKRCELMWDQREKEHVSISEWYIISIAARGGATVSEIARAADITRQAAHKYIEGLCAKGFLEDVKAAGTGRGRFVALTDHGKRSWEKFIALEQRMEGEIAKKIGEENMGRLMELLRRDWH